MRVILIDKIANLGDIGEIVNVKSGYARNFLIPNSKAMLATKENILFSKTRRTELDDQLSKLRSEAMVVISKLEKLGSVVIFARSGIEGKLFGSIGARDIANSITKSGINIFKRNVRLPHGIIRRIGDYDVNIQIFHGISTTLKVSVVTSE